MDLISHLPKELIFLDLKADDKWSMLDEHIKSIAKTSCFAKLGVSIESVREGLFEREKNISTGLGKGAAFPHIRHPEMQDMLLSLAILKQPVPYDSIDGQPVTIVCMILAPDQEPTIALKVRGTIARLLSDASFRQNLLASENPQAVLDLIKNYPIDLDIPITARDIMRTELICAEKSTPLKTVTRLLSENHTNAIAVRGEKREIIGEITCDNLFRYGMPAFFAELKSVAFIPEFDPFEKYFHAESHCVAGDLMSPKFAAMPPSATLLELVFTITVLKHEKVYIVDKGVLVGEVDESLVLDKIMRL